MPADRTQNPYRPLIVAAVLLVLVAIVGYASTVLIPIALGVLLSFILAPAVAWMQSRGVQRRYAVLLVVGATLLVLVGMLAALTSQLRALARDVDKHQTIIKDKIHDLTGGKEKGVFGRLAQLIEEVGEGDDAEKPDLKVQTVRIQPERRSAFSIVPVVAGPAWAVLGKISLTL